MAVIKRPRPTHNVPSLPAKGWCFHRGAKLSLAQAPEAIWYCPSCQNFASLDRLEQAL
jgi:hypothetical protein